MHEIKWVSLDALKPNLRNARTHSKKQIRQIADSILAYGFTVPLLTDESGVIIAGHGRLAAAKFLGLSKVPVIVLEGLSEAKKRALLLADNKIAENAGGDRELLAVELPELAELLIDEELDISITGERIRDKIAAFKKKGMWMGGQPPLGYDVKDRRLAINPDEAEIVQIIFRRYLDLKSVRTLKESLDASGVVSKARTASDGSAYGSKPIAMGALYHLLQNRIYRGEIVHKDKSYPGEHQAIVDEGLWDDVQTILASNRVGRANGATAKAPSLLAGILFDVAGERMTPSHAVKKGTRYRYYVSRPLISGGDAANTGGQRIPAVSLEALVARRIQDWLADAAAVLDAIRHHVPDGIAQQHTIAGAMRLGASWHGLCPDEVRGLLLSICRRVQVHVDRLEMTIDSLALVRRIEPQIAGDDAPPAKTPPADVSPLVLIIPARLRRAGMEMRMVVDDGSEPANVDPGLVRVLVRAFAIRDQLFNDHSLSPNDIAEREGIVPSYATRLFRLTFLAPDIIATILDGRHPPELTLRKLLDDTRLPLDWSEQRASLGFA